MFERYTAHLRAVGVVVSYKHSSDNAASSTTVGATVPYSAVGGENTLFGRCTELVLWSVYVQPSTVLPPLTLLLGQMLPVFMRLAARSSTVLPPLHYCWGRCCPFLHDPLPCYCKCCPFFIRLAARSSTVLPPPYTTVGADAARFYAVSCAIVCCTTPPTQHLGYMLPVLVR